MGQPTLNEMIAIQVKIKLDELGHYRAEEGFDGSDWDSQNYKDTDRAVSDILWGTEEGNFQDGSLEDIMTEINAFVDSQVQVIVEHKERNRHLAFDPVI